MKLFILLSLICVCRSVPMPGGSKTPGMTGTITQLAYGDGASNSATIINSVSKNCGGGGGGTTPDDGGSTDGGSTDGGSTDDDCKCTTDDGSGTTDDSGSTSPGGGSSTPCPPSSGGGGGGLDVSALNNAISLLIPSLKLKIL